MIYTETMDHVAQVKDIMTDDAVTVSPETSITEAAQVLVANHFNGLPVIDADKKLIGLLTEYNLIADLFSQSGKIHDRLSQLSEIKVKEVMDTTPLTLYFDNTFEDALKLFNDHHRVNPVPVIDRANRLVGVVSRFDLIKLLKLYGHS